MATPKSDNIQPNTPKPLDNRVGLGFVDGEWMPYASIADAIADAKISSLSRYLGMTLQVYSDGILQEFWFRDGLTDSDLILKSTSSGGGSSFEYLSTAPIASPDSGYTITVSELIGADLSFFRAYRGTGTFLSGSDSPATENSVQVNTTTGVVTYFAPFSADVDEMLSFDYKKGNQTSPGDSPVYFSDVFDSNFQ